MVGTRRLDTSLTAGTLNKVWICGFHSLHLFDEIRSDFQWWCSSRDVRRGLFLVPKNCTVPSPPTIFNGTCLSDVIRGNMVNYATLADIVFARQDAKKKTALHVGGWIVDGFSK